MNESKKFLKNVITDHQNLIGAIIIAIAIIVAGVLIANAITSGGSWISRAIVRS